MINNYWQYSAYASFHKKILPILTDNSDVTFNSKEQIEKPQRKYYIS